MNAENEFGRTAEQPTYEPRNISDEELIDQIERDNETAKTLNEEAKNDAETPKSLDGMIATVIEKADRDLCNHLSVEMVETRDRLHKQERQGLKGILYTLKIFSPSEFSNKYLLEQTINNEIDEMKNTMVTLEKQTYVRETSNDDWNDKFEGTKEKMVESYAKYEGLKANLDKLDTRLAELREEKATYISEKYGGNKEVADDFIAGIQGKVAAYQRAKRETKRVLKDTEKVIGRLKRRKERYERRAAGEEVHSIKASETYDTISEYYEELVELRDDRNGQQSIFELYKLIGAVEKRAERAGKIFNVTYDSIEKIVGRTENLKPYKPPIRTCLTKKAVEENNNDIAAALEEAKGLRYGLNV